MFEARLQSRSASLQNSDVLRSDWTLVFTPLLNDTHVSARQGCTPDVHRPCESQIDNFRTLGLRNWAALLRACVRKTAMDNAREAAMVRTEADQAVVRFLHARSKCRCHRRRSTAAPQLLPAGMRPQRLSSGVVAKERCSVSTWLLSAQRTLLADLLRSAALQNKLFTPVSTVV